MSRITASAAGKSCTARIPGVCRHDNATVVWAHLNSVRWGAGKGQKSPDICGLYADQACHDAIDGRLKKDRDGNRLDPNFVRTCAYEGHMESLALLECDGIIGILPPEEVVQEVFKSPFVKPQAT